MTELTSVAGEDVPQAVTLTSAARVFVVDGDTEVTATRAIVMAWLGEDLGAGAVATDYAAVFTTAMEAV